MNKFEEGETFTRWIGLLQCMDCGDNSIIAPTRQPITADRDGLTNSVLQVAVFVHGKGVSGMQRCTQGGGLTGDRYNVLSITQDDNVI